MANTSNTNEKKGLLHADGLMVVQKKKTAIGDSGDYYYTLGLTNGTDMLIVTSGKIADSLELLKKYNFGFDFVDKKLRLVSCEAGV